MLIFGLVMTNSVSVDNAQLQHIGFICDGNDTWSSVNGVRQRDGYIRGFDAVTSTINSLSEIGIPYATMYLFSTENWGRSQEWIVDFSNLAHEMISDRLMSAIWSSGARIKFIGETSRFSDSIQNAMADVERDTAHNTKITVHLATSYGGRHEIIKAAREVAESGKQITEESINENLYTAGAPDPDLIIRTKGVQRLSNFMLWQASYSEFYFAKCLWPDFDRNQLNLAIEEYGRRTRTFGRK